MNEERKARLRARAARLKEEERKKEWEKTLGAELMAALLRYLGMAAPEKRTRLEQIVDCPDYSDELKKLLVRSIETCPALEETFLDIAALAFCDGEAAANERSFYDNYEM